MRWISVDQLAAWANTIPARIGFPALIRDLIVGSFQNIADITHLRLPSNGAGQVRGFDGDLTSAGAPPYVPTGRSIWEFGVSEDAQDKFAKDYAKRVKEISATERKGITFVFATPRKWDNPQRKLPDFVRDYRKKQDFADVRYIDGAQLDHWLESNAAVGANFVRDVVGLMPALGVRSTDEFWHEYRSRFQPQMNEQVVLCGRDDHADRIVKHLQQGNGPLIFVGDGPDEVTAVAVAAIRSADPLDRKHLEARTLIVDAVEAGRAVGVANRHSYILSPSAQPIAGLLATFGPTVGAMTAGSSSAGAIQFRRPSTRDFSEALKSLPLPDAAAEALAVKSGRSLTILERRAPAAGHADPAWKAHGTVLLPAMLAGAWDSRSPGDQRAIEHLAGIAYQQAENQIRGFANGQDAPLDREGSVWKLRAPVDAFATLAALIGPADLDRLAKVAIDVFTDPEPPSPTQERFGVSTAAHSTWLRDGIATTLLIIAVLHEEVGLNADRDAPVFVDDLVRSLPGLQDDYRVIESLGRQLPFLMEASPDPLLAALEHQLEGDQDVAHAIFAEASRFGVPASSLPNLLWALETAAWDPRHLPRVSMILARLASLDPGGSLGNRPHKTLREIFVAWKPGTNASLEERLAVLDEIVRRFPLVGWRLLVQLLPKSNDMISPTSRPRFRDAGASQREVLTQNTVFETYNAVIDRTLAQIDDGVGRAKDILEAYPNFSDDRRAEFVIRLERYARTVSGDERNELRRALNALIGRHARFESAGWALSGAEVQKLRNVAALLESDDPYEQARRLFDEWSPLHQGDLAAAERRIEDQRKQELTRLVATDGIAAVMKLASMVRFPGMVGSVAAAAVTDPAEMDALLDAAATAAEPSDLGISLSAALRYSRGEGFASHLLEVAKTRGWTEEQTAGLLLGWPEAPETWTLVDSLGRRACGLFWSRRQVRRSDIGPVELAELVERFLKAGRPGAALQAVWQREAELDKDLLFKILGARQDEIVAEGAANEMDAFHVEELLKSMRARTDVLPIELARWEYAFFPLIEYHMQDLALYELMASDPEFFVSILKDVFVADDAGDDDAEPTKEEQNRAFASYRIIMSFKRMPGETDGRVDADVLNRWVDGMVAEASRAKRTRVVNSSIGRVLAHAPEEDGLWPPAPVADVIERFASTDLENGIRTERYNMRGVYTKAIFEGGRQERDLEEQYRGWAVLTPATSIRTRSLLERIADSWAQDAKRADESAEHDRLRFQ